MNWNPSFPVSEKITKIFLYILFFCVLTTGVCFAHYSFTRGNLYLFLFGVLPCGFFSGVLAVKLFLPAIGDFFGFGILFPRKFLQKAPPVLSPFIGMLNSGNYEAAYTGLLPLVQEHPGNPDAVLLFAQASMRIPGRERAGFEAMEHHFSLDNREDSRNHLKLLFFYADKAREYQYYTLLVQILSQESQKKCYTELEKKSIMIRLDSVRRGFNEY